LVIGQVAGEGKDHPASDQRAHHEPVGQEAEYAPEKGKNESDHARDSCGAIAL
jgi:hypothetical protein